MVTNQKKPSRMGAWALGGCSDTPVRFLSILQLSMVRRRPITAVMRNQGARSPRWPARAHPRSPSGPGRWYWTLGHPSSRGFASPRPRCSAHALAHYWYCSSSARWRSAPCQPTKAGTGEEGGGGG